MLQILYGGCKGPLSVTFFYCCICTTVHYCLQKAELMITDRWKVLNCDCGCDSCLSWLTAGLAWKHLIFCYLGNFEFYNFLCIFSADSLWAARHRESGDRKRRGLSSWPSLQTAEREGQGYYKMETDRESQWRSFVFSDEQLTIGFSSFSHTSIFGGYFCSGVSGQLATQKPCPVPKQVPSSVLQCRICLFFIPTPFVVYFSSFTLQFKNNIMMSIICLLFCNIKKQYIFTSNLLFCLLFVSLAQLNSDSERPIQWKSIENQHNTPKLKV